MHRLGSWFLFSCWYSKPKNNSSFMDSSPWILLSFALPTFGIEIGRHVIPIFRHFLLLLWLFLLFGLGLKKNTGALQAIHTCRRSSTLSSRINASRAAVVWFGQSHTARRYGGIVVTFLCQTCFHRPTMIEDALAVCIVIEHCFGDDKDSRQT